MNFFLELIKSNSGTSSKRFISLYSLVLLTAIIVGNVFFKLNVNDIIYYILSGLVIGSSALTIPYSSKTPEEKENL